MSANSVARYKNTLNAAFNWYIKENGLEITSPFAGLLIKGAGSSKVDRLPLQDEHIKLLEPAMKDSEIAWALYVLLRDSGARVAEIAGLRVQDCDIEQGVLQITPIPWQRLKTKTSERSVPLSQEAATLLKDLTKGKAAEEPVFERYAKDRGMDNCSQMLMKRLRTVITDKKLTMHSLSGAIPECPRVARGDTVRADLNWLREPKYYSLLYLLVSFS